VCQFEAVFVLNHARGTSSDGLSDGVRHLDLTDQPLGALARHGLERPVRQRRDVSAQHLVRIGRIEGHSLDKIVIDEPKTAGKAGRDHMLVRAWGKLRHDRNLAGKPGPLA
jgi:hypothetical protein